MRRPRLIALATLVTAAMGTSIGLIGPAASADTAPAYQEYVALGDSWSADVLVTFPPETEFVPIDCAQSSTNYPHQIAALLHVPTFRDATCGSATSDNMTEPQSGLPLGGTAEPQFNKLTPTTDLVTLGIGGNDIGLAGAITSCLNLLPVDVPGLSSLPLFGGCEAKFTSGGVDQMSEAIEQTAPKIVKTIAAIRERSPKARILLVNYLDAVPLNGKGCYPLIPVADTDMSYVAEKFQEMNAMLADVATTSGVQLVDTFTPTVGHDVCQAPTVRYAEGLVPLSAQNSNILGILGIAFPFHPNQAGANAQTQAVYAAITHPTTTDQPTVDPSDAPTATPAASVAVKRLTATARKLKSGKTRLIASVKVPAGVSPRGKIVFTVRSKTAKARTVKGRVNAHGKAASKAVKLAKGRATLKVCYAGNAAVAPATTVKKFRF